MLLFSARTPTKGKSLWTILNNITNQKLLNTCGVQRSGVQIEQFPWKTKQLNNSNSNSGFWWRKAGERKFIFEKWNVLGVMSMGDDLLCDQPWWRVMWWGVEWCGVWCHDMYLQWRWWRELIWKGKTFSKPHKSGIDHTASSCKTDSTVSKDLVASSGLKMSSPWAKQSQEDRAIMLTSSAVILLVVIMLVSY